MSSLQIPAALQAALAQQDGPDAGQGPPLPTLGGPPPGTPLPGLEAPGSDEQEGQGGSQLDCLKETIDDFPRLLTELQDPKDVQDAVGALRLLAGIQTRLMSSQGASGPAAQA